MHEGRRTTVVMVMAIMLFVGCALLLGGLVGSTMGSYGPEDEIDPGNPHRLWAVEVAENCAPARGLIQEKLADGRMTAFELQQIRDLAKAFEGPTCVLPSNQAPDTIIVPYVPT